VTITVVFYQIPMSSEKLVFVVLLLIHLVPIWKYDYFPSQDGPSHLNNANVIRNYYRKDFGIFREYYQLAHRFGVNWVTHLALAGLMSVFPVLVAEKILLSGYVLLFMFAVRYAILSINTDSVAISFLAFPFVYNWPMHMGFYSFVYSLPLFLFCIGYWAKHKDDFGFLQMVTLVVLSFFLYLTNMLSLFLALGVIGVMVAWLMFAKGFNYISIQFGRNAVADYFKHRALLPLLSFLPALFVTLVFWSRRGLSDSLIDYPKILLSQILSFQRSEAVVFLLIGVLFVFLVVAVRFGLSQYPIENWDGFLVASVFCFFIYLVAPESVFREAGEIRPRLLLYPILVIVLWLGAQTYRPILKRAIICCSAALAITLLVMNSTKYGEFNDYLHEYVSAKYLIKPHSTVLPIEFTYATMPEAFDWFTQRSPDPFLHASGYIAAETGSVDLENYEAQTNHFPTTFRYNRNPFRYIGIVERPLSGLDLTNYHWRTGGQIDYVLVWSIRNAAEDLRRAGLTKQLEDGYSLIYVSPRGLTELYRRNDRMQSKG
jgi:hypothetical protein